MKEKCIWEKMNNEVAMTIPSEEHYRKGNIYINSCWIPYDYENAYKVFFVSDTNGNEYGQYPSLSEAMMICRSLEIEE